MVEVPDPRRSEADKVQSIQVGTKRFRKVLSSFCPGGMVSIVMISEALLLRATATDGRILRDRVLGGFGIRLNARKRTFLIATSVCDKQFRMMLGHWPLISVEDARAKAMEGLHCYPALTHAGLAELSSQYNLQRLMHE